MCVAIETSENCHAEQSEVFMVQMRRTADLNSRIMLSTDSAVVNIRDDDCKLVFTPGMVSLLYNIFFQISLWV